jgi:hypothetical protein
MESVLIGLLRDLWSETWRNAPLLRDILSHGFAAPKGFQVHETEWPSLQRDILFLGLNPVHSEPRDRITAHSVHLNEDAPLFPEFIFDASESFGNADFPAHFREINHLIQQAKLSPRSVAYHNLFFSPIEEQMPIRAIMDVPSGHDFLCGQLSITDWYIRHIIRPRMIVVVHAEACDYLGLNADWNTVPPRNVWMGYMRSAEVDQVMGLYRISAIHPALSEEAELESLAIPMYVLPIDNLADQSSHTRALLAWHISRGSRLLSSAPKGLLTGETFMELLELLEVRLADVRRNKHAAVAEGNYGWAASDRDKEHQLVARIADLVDKLK